MLRHDTTPARTTTRKPTTDINPHTQTHTVTLPPDKLLWCVPACVKLDKSVFFRGPLRGWNEKNVPHNRGNSSIVSELLQWDYTTWTFVLGVLQACRCSFFLINQPSLVIIPEVSFWVYSTEPNHWNPNLYTSRLLQRRHASVFVTLSEMQRYEKTSENMEGQ